MDNSIDYTLPMSVDNEDTPQPPTEIDDNDLTKFKHTVREWLSLDDDIAKLKKALKERNKKRKELEPDILEFMKQNGINDLNTREGGRLHYHTTNAKRPINKEFIISKLTGLLNNSERATEITEHLFENREQYERYSLKRTDKPS
jgi:hypothetical protein